MGPMTPQRYAAEGGGAGAGSNGAIGAGAGSNEAIGAGVGFGARFLALALLAGFAFFIPFFLRAGTPLMVMCLSLCDVTSQDIIGRPFRPTLSSALTKWQDGCAKPKFYSDCKAGTFDDLARRPPADQNLEPHSPSVNT